MPSSSFSSSPLASLYASLCSVFLLSMRSCQQNPMPRRPSTATASPTTNIRSQWTRSSASSRRRTAFTVSAILVLLLLAMVPSAECATFFYGATEDSDAVERGEPEQQLETVPAEHTLALAENSAHHHSADDEEDETRLSTQELESVYKFCSLLPLLEESGHVVKNQQARQVCDKLVTMLKPMFRKRNKAIRPRRAMMLTERRRR